MLKLAAIETIIELEFIIDDEKLYWKQSGSYYGISFYYDDDQVQRGGDNRRT